MQDHSSKGEHAMRNTRTLSTLAIAAAGSLFLAACGGNDAPEQGYDVTFPEVDTTTEEAVEPTEEAVEDAWDATGEAAEDAWEVIEDAAEDTVEATEDAAEDAQEYIEE